MKECFGKSKTIDPGEYIRRCGCCGVTCPQKEMIRDDCSDTGWLCYECDSELYVGYDSYEF